MVIYYFFKVKISFSYSIGFEVAYFLGINFVKVLREKDGIPDLRRVARFRYASVSLPEVWLNITVLLEIQILSTFFSVA